MAIFDNPSREILKGAEVVAKLISLSYGAQQNNILLQRRSGLTHTFSALAICNEVRLENPLMEIGVRLMRDVCLKMDSNHGDGASTAILMAYRGMAESTRLMGDVAIKHEEVEASIRCLKSTANVKGLLNVVSEPEATPLLLEALQEIGEDGTILIQDGQKVEATLEFKEGMPAPFKRPNMKFKDEMLEGAMVAVFNYPLCDERDIVPVLEESSQWPDNPLIIFTPYIVGDALRICLSNQDRIPNVALVPAKVKPNQVESHLKDLASCANGSFICRNHMDTKQFDPSWFGFFRKVDFKEDSLEITFYNEEEYVEARDKRISELEGELVIAPTNYDQREIRKRISYLDEGVAVIGVGGHTELERKVNRAKYEKWVLTAQSASGGVVGDIKSSLQTLSEDCLNVTLKKMLLEPPKLLEDGQNPLSLSALSDAIRVSASVVNEYAKIKKAVTIPARKGK